MFEDYQKTRKNYILIKHLMFVSCVSFYVFVSGILISTFLNEPIISLLSAGLFFLIIYIYSICYSPQKELTKFYNKYNISKEVKEILDRIYSENISLAKFVMDNFSKIDADTLLKLDKIIEAINNLNKINGTDARLYISDLNKLEKLRTNFSDKLSENDIETIERYKIKIKEIVLNQIAEKDKINDFKNEIDDFICKFC